MKELQKPRCLAMILCDLAHTDRETGKFTLLGTFDHLAADRLPVKADFSAYVCITEALGDVPLALRIVDADSLGERPLAQMTGMLHGRSPLDILQMAIRVKLSFPRAGLYHFELFSGDEVLMSRRLMVNVLKKPKRKSS